MNRISREKQEMILSLMVEGNTIRGIERLTGIHRNTIIRLVRRIGLRCENYMESYIRLLICKQVEIDELVTTVWAKQHRIPESEKSPEIGEQYVFIAIDRDTKLIPAFHIGKRNTTTAITFLEQLRGRIVNTFQLSSDQWHGYENAVRDTFGFNVHYGQIKKMYYNNDGGRDGYVPATLQGVRIKVKLGYPNRSDISTSIVERNNLTIRMQNSRYGRLTNAISKKLECLRASTAIHLWHYNFMRFHSSIKTIPAIAAGLRTTPECWGSLLY